MWVGSEDLHASPRVNIQWDSSQNLDFTTKPFNFQAFWHHLSFSIIFIFPLWLQSQLKPQIFSVALRQLPPCWISSGSCGTSLHLYLWLHLTVAKTKLFPTLHLLLPTPFSEHLSCLTCDFIPRIIWNFLTTHKGEEWECLPVCLGVCETWSQPMELKLIPAVWFGIGQNSDTSNFPNGKAAQII